MRRSRRTTIVVVLVLGLAAAGAPAAQAGAPPSERQGSVSAKKKKAKKCKKGRVRERFRKKTRCVSARKALPKPKAIDMRKASTSFLLNASFSKLRDRRGRRLPSLPKLLRKVHPRAEKALLGATKAGLARMDARARAAQAPCANATPGSTSSTYNAGGGVSVGISSTVGAESSMQLNLESNNNNRRVRIELEFGACQEESSSQIDSCPTADGTVRGRDFQRVGLRVFVYERDTLTWSQGFRLQGETTFRGVVADDAKLDFMEPHNTEQATISLGGSSRGFAPFTLRTLVQRITRVNMRTGEYVLGPSIIDVSISSQGIAGSERREAEARVGGDMRAQANKQFADIIDKAIRKYRERERAWNEPNTCASVDFTPASNARPLHLGDTGTVSARVLAKPGGSPDRATWTRLGATNATFSPDTASSVPANFSYGGIAAAGPGISVTGTFKAVSKAGVAQGTWTQSTENPTLVNTIAGTFSGLWNQSGSIFRWSGTASFARYLPGPGANGSFMLTSGQYTVTASGRDATGGTSCRQSGTKQVTLTNNGNIDVEGRGPERTAPYDYTGSAAALGPGEASMTVTWSDCPDPQYNGQQATVGLPFLALDTAGSKVSADGLDYTGASSRSAGGLTQEWNWAMRGTP